MSVEGGLTLLVLYLMHQLGMVLGFGAQIIMLLTYLRGKRDGTINETEDGMAHGVYRVLIIALGAVVVSGIGMTVLFVQTMDPVLYEPAFVAKWLLLVWAVMLAVGLKGSRIWDARWEGLSAANWCALFLLHIFAPITTFIVLVKLYAVFVVGFVVAWALLLFGIRGQTHWKREEPPAPVKETTVADVLQKVRVEPPPPMRPVAPISVPTPQPAPVVSKPAFSLSDIVPRMTLPSVSVFAKKAPPSIAKIEPTVPLAPVPPKRPVGAVELPPPAPVPVAAATIPPATPVTESPLVAARQKVEQPNSVFEMQSQKEIVTPVVNVLDDPQHLSSLPELKVMPRSLEELRELEERRRHPQTA